MIRAAIWDMDGTLVDTAEQHFQAWLATCRTLGRDFTRADFAATFGRRNPEILKILFGDRFSPEEVQRIGDEKENAYRDAVRKGVTLLPGVDDLMKALQAAGWKQAVGSSAPRANLELMLELTGIDRYLAALVGAEDTSRGKPDPQVFLVAAKRLGVEPSHSIVF
jgi:beta-phosphoglucomutase